VIAMRGAAGFGSSIRRLPANTGHSRGQIDRSLADVRNKTRVW
jgi:hypothetical protein